MELEGKGRMSSRVWGWDSKDKVQQNGSDCRHGLKKNQRWSWCWGSKGLQDSS
jgi:hypothetical protein